MTDTEEMDQLRVQITQTVAQRDALKLAIENGNMPAKKGLRELVEIDARLSKLDSQFKSLWDNANLSKLF